MALKRLVGTDQNQVPMNHMLGSLAFQNSDSVSLGVVAIDRGTAAVPTFSFNGDPNTGLFSPDLDQVAISTNGTERFRITSTGQVRLAGAGITFNGDTATANELDDYEEGTWTPTIIGSTTAGTATYANANGRYTRIGRLVHVELFVQWSGGTGTGNLRVSGLPFTASNVGTNSSLSIGSVDSVATPANTIPTAIVLDNSTSIRIDALTVGGGAAAQVAYDAAGSLLIGGCYSV